MRAKLSIVIAALVVLAALVVILFIRQNGAAAAQALPEQQAAMAIGGVHLTVALAVTPAQQALGLGGRTGLPANTGMLFMFPQDGKYAFWMKDMHFPIDIIWLASDGTVAYLVPDLSPSTYPQSYAPNTPARYVLEVPANFAAQHKIVVGTKAVLP